ncbi:MAG: DUF4147 domain-containing protein [Planctomycetota bacterium]|nr:DUF4147 domain-containing protein [Planctomycetota bacterium]
MNAPVLTIEPSRDLQADLRQVLNAVQRAADPGECLAVETSRLRAFVGDGRAIHVLAVGKASVPMLNAVSRLSGVRWKRLLATVVPEWLPRSLPMAQLAAAGELLECDHPVATERNLHAAAKVRQFVSSIPSDESLLVLLSGGASAHLTLPVEGLSLSSLVACTTDLMRSGASIHELNTVRKHLEQLKGGRLASMCTAGNVLVLVLSDVIGDPLDVIASGPFVADPSMPQDAIAVLRARGLWGRHPAVEALLERTSRASHRAVQAVGAIEHVVIGNNAGLVDAAAGALAHLGYRLDEVHKCRQGPVDEVLAMLAVRSGGGPSACVVGGEWVVQVGEASGRGGPSQELALLAAVRGDGEPGWAMLTYSSDGIDGPTNAAGAIVDGETVSRSERAGCYVARAVVEHDSHRALAAAGVLLNPGPTGTNVNHIAVLVRDS